MHTTEWRDVSLVERKQRQKSNWNWWHTRDQQKKNFVSQLKLEARKKIPKLIKQWIFRQQQKICSPTPSDFITKLFSGFHGISQNSPFTSTHVYDDENDDVEGQKSIYWSWKRETGDFWNSWMNVVFCQLPRSPSSPHIPTVFSFSFCSLKYHNEECQNDENMATGNCELSIIHSFHFHFHPPIRRAEHEAYMKEDFSLKIYWWFYFAAYEYDLTWTKAHS